MGIMNLMSLLGVELEEREYRLERLKVTMEREGVYVEPKTARCRVWEGPEDRPIISLLRSFIERILLDLNGKV